jgi:LIM domain
MQFRQTRYSYTEGQNLVTQIILLDELSYFAVPTFRLRPSCDYWYQMANNMCPYPFLTHAIAASTLSCLPACEQRRLSLPRRFRFEQAAAIESFVCAFFIPCLRLMALYVGASAADLPALFQLGFSAQIQNVSTRKFVSSDASGCCVVVEEQQAPVWNLVSRDFSVGEAAATSRCAVTLSTGSACDSIRYLDLHGTIPTISNDPAVVRVVFPSSANVAAENVEFGFRQVLQEKRRLSTRGASTASGTALASETADGNSERFRLHVLVDSIGREGVNSCRRSDASFVSVAEAMALAVLELGVRFRLRSVHGRVLRTTASGPGAGTVADEVDSGDNATVGKPKKELSAERKRKAKPSVVLVLQDGPKSSEDETLAGEILFESIRRAKHYVFTSVVDNRVMSVKSSNLKTSRDKTLHETAALLVTHEAGWDQEQQPPGFLDVVPAKKRWGFVHVGGSVEVDGKQVTEWLMAGMRGRLETRRHRSSWESFRVEYIKQSLDAALRELPHSSIFNNADTADRAHVRAEVAAQVASARSSDVPGPRASSKQKKSGFNHAAALGGLSGDAETSGRAKNCRSSEPLSAPLQSSKQSSKATIAGGSGKAATVVAATSALPRNVVSRRVDKKAKARARKAAKKAATGSASSGNGGKATAASLSSPLSASGGSSSNSSSGSDGGESTSRKRESEHQSDAASSSTVSAAGSSGPPCSACGRVVTGTYTKALGKSFHPQCFCCRNCRRPMLPGTGQFRERGGVPYCNSCYANNIAPRCARCCKPIMETVTTAMEKTWHKECLTCTICRLPLTQQFFLYADKPNEPRCSRCVTGREEPIERMGYGKGSGRAVNLPGPLFRQGGSTGGGLSMNASGGMSPPGGSGGTTSGGGRARITTPVLPVSARR